MSWWEELGATAPDAWTIGPVSRTDFVRYQGASGDMNPVHHDEVFAKKAGFDAPLGIGMYTAGLMNSWATAWLGADGVRSTRMRWKKAVFPGAVLTFGGAIVKGWLTEEGERRVELELRGVDAEGDVVVQGWMVFVVPGPT